MIKKSCCFFMLILAGALASFATPQIPDTLIYGGKKYPIYNDVLHAYFLKYPERNPKREDYRCSARWNGYRATFEVIGGKLFLKEITDMPCEEDRASALKKVVPNGEPMFIAWHTGVLLSMYGQNDENPYGLKSLDAFAEYSLFEIDSGVLRREKHLTNKQYIDYRKRHFKVYKKTPEYKEKLNKLIENNRMKKKEADADLRFWIFWNAKSLLVD